MKKPLIIFLVGSILSSSSATDVPTKCLQNNGALKYEAGQSYFYNYGVHAQGQFRFDGSSREANNPLVHINGTAILTTLSECEYILTLKDTIISSRPTNGEGQETETGKAELEKSSLRFTMNNAIVQDVFFGADDPSWLVNLKKTILFMIQNRGLAIVEKEKEIETSVFGDCLTEYINTDKSYVKMTHLKKCGQGEGSDLIFQGVPYNIPLVTNKPIFGFLRPDAHIRCVQTVANDILSDVICSEQSHGHHGLSLVSVLKFSEKVSNTNNNEEELKKLVLPTPVLYNFTKSYSKLMEDNAVEKVKELLLKSHKSDDSNKAEIYIELKKAAARVFDLEQFTTSEYIGEEIHKDIFYDALAEVSTDEAIRVVANAANKGQLDATTLLNFYANIAFASAPGVKSLQSLAELVRNWSIKKPESTVDSDAMKAFKNNVSLGQHLLLGASGLAHQYCKLTNSGCLEVPEYQALVDGIASHANMEKSEDEIVLGAIQALGNLDALTPSAVEAIQNIFAQSKTPIWLEIQAMDSFRRAPCQPNLKETVRKTLGDSSKTDQVRIHAYLAVSRCITAQDLNAIHNILLQADSAVGGFIGSHIRNIQASSSPSKTALKSILSEIRLPENVMSVHNRSRISKYVEHSHFNHKENYGFSGEATIIFIPGQAQPEFVSFNATMDLFGRSFNFLEVGLSQRSLMKSMMFQGDEVPADWGIHQAVGAKDSYIRVLGTTIALDLETLHGTIQTALTKTLSGATLGMIIDLIQPSSYLDEELTFPTIAGLPLSLDLQGVSFDTIKLEMIGDSDFSSMFGFPSSMSETESSSSKPDSKTVDYKISMFADSAATIKGAISLGAHTPIHTGYQLEGKVDQKQNFGIAISSKDGPKLDLDLKINFPNKIISSRDISFDIFGFEEIQGKTVKLRDNGKKNGMLGESLSSQRPDCWNFEKVLGFKACCNERTGGSYPKLFSCSMEKESPEMEGYDIKITSDGAEFTPSYEMTVTTPGSKTNRLFKVAIKSDQKNEETPGNWDSRDVTVTAELNAKKYTGHVFWNRSEVIQFPAMIPYDIDLSVDYSESDAKSAKQLLKFTAYQPKENALNVEAKFDGALQILGDFKGNSVYKFTPSDAESDRYASYQLNKHFEWTSDILKCKTSGDLETDYVTNGTSTFSAKLNQNNRIYQLQHNWALSVVEGDLVVVNSEDTENEGKYKYSYRPLLERLDKHRIIVTYHPGKQYELDLGVGYKRLPGDGNNHTNNFTLDIKPNSFTKHPVSAKLFFSQENYGDVFNSSLTLDAEGEKKVKLSSDFKQNSGLLLNGDIKEVGEFSWNLTQHGRNSHIHMDIKYNYNANLEMILDSDITDDGNELKTKTEFQFEDKRKKSILNSESHLDLHRSKRTMDYLSKTTQTEVGRGQQLLAKFEMHAEAPEDYWNGKSFAKMRLEDQNGKAYTASVNQTVASSEDKYLKSNFALDFHPPGEKTPFNFNWDLKVDTQLTHGDEHESEIHITSDKHFTGFFMTPFDFLIKKDIHLHKLKGKNVYEWISSSNITDKGRLERSTELQLTVSGHDEAWKSVTVKADGFTQCSNYRDTFSGQLDSEEMDDKLRSSRQKANFKVDRTDLNTKTTSNLIDGVLNKTSYFHDIMDFEMTENGHVRIENKKSINWIQLVRFHKNELTIFKEVEEIDANDAHFVKFLFHVSAKVLDENHQTKVILNSRHSLLPDSPVSNLNFTLSK